MEKLKAASLHLVLTLGTDGRQEPENLRVWMVMMNQEFFDHSVFFQISTFKNSHVSSGRPIVCLSAGEGLRVMYNV